jgi:phosphopentomutase
MPSFGTAGVRGVFNVTQTPEQIYRLALTSAFVFGKGRYGIGWDGRKSSALISRVAAAGVASAGSEPFLFGLIPTPVTAFGARQTNCKLGFSVTASHNPPEYSGMKVFDHHGMELSKEDEIKIERAMLVGSRMESKDFGDIIREEVLETYINSMLSRFEQLQNEAGLKIVVDCSNGPGACVTPKVLERLGHCVIPLNSQISWRFPARPPEPTVSSLSETASIVSALGANIGFAHDGDADRLVMINSAGRVLPDSLVSIIAMKALIKKKEGGGVVALSENSSSAVEDEALGLGMKVIRSRIGKTFADIEKEGAIFATEPSKVVDPNWGMWEDGMYAAALIADAVARDRSLLELMNAEPAWHYRQVNLPFSVDVSRVAQTVEENFERFRILEVRRLDGLKIIFRDRSWIMFRASGTEPKTRIYCESLDPVRLDELIAIGKSLLEEMSSTAARGLRSR